MSKKLIPEGIDEKALLASIYAKKHPEAPIIAKSSSDIEENNNEPATAKTNMRKRKVTKGSYSEDFLKKKEKGTKRPSVYIEQELHEIITSIVKVLAKKVTVGEYIDMILWEHLLKNKDEINSLYRQDRNDLIKDKFD
jgi:hypothetical protein